MLRVAGVASLYPSRLLQGGAPGGLSDGDPAPCWWLCRTLPRQEKVAAEQLLLRQVPFYLPLIEHRSLQRGRARVSHVPMFGGYVFAYGGAEERLRALQTKRLASVEPVSDGDQLRHDLQQIQRLIEGGAALTACERIMPGQPVRVKSGPFAGVEGVVVRRRRKSELLVTVNYLQQGALMAIEDWMTEPL